MTPNDWRSLRLADVLDEPIRNGYSPVCPNEFTGKWILSLGEVTHEGFNPRALKSAPLDDARVDAAVLRAGDIVVGRSNTRERVGLAGLYKGSPHPCTYPDLLMRVRLGSVAAPEFVIFCLLSNAGRDYFQQTARGTSGSMLKIDRAILEGFPLRLPPLGEQRKIAAVLSSVDDAIETTQAVIDQLGVVKKAMMAGLLTRGLPGRHARFKQTEIGEVPEDWELVQLQDVIAEGPTNGLYQPAEKIGRGALVAGMTAITGATLDWTLCRRAELDDAELSRFGLRCHDLLVTRVYARVDGIGRFILVPYPPEPVGYESNMMRLRVNTERAVPAFVAGHMALGKVRREIEQRATLGAQASINNEGVRTLPLRLPPIGEQVEIVSALDSVEQRVVTELKALGAVRTLKKALMSVLLTGEVRVKPDEERAA
jgi:type I restriction enzyme S subunit